MPRFSPQVIDHFTNPRNCGRLPSPDVAAFVGNPVCGDQILLTAHVHDGVITDIAFEAFGCSASLAVASIVTERLRGSPLSDAAVLDQEQVAAWAGGLSPDQRHVAALGADVARRLAENHRDGITDDAPVAAG
ncbi:MAG TPA: iron-sulfur cluster assembly scaffold protein [Mycobacterium sp.]|nr:MAG: iron-sulfur cluster assembly scaffold protein [Mycobacterium sp.]HOB47955.1 iron-sulfur cluster assembly scaffold protein [Mycobacterium sp.]HPZ93704.1 iron-sulfur cluster assembly scaffold protein [Mycobacterium sp.]HQE13895.1 iron-sulfur cluster assembly scaffold protein [Mycobacterium sp.]